MSVKFIYNPNFMIIYFILLCSFVMAVINACISSFKNKSMYILVCNIILFGVYDLYTVNTFSEDTCVIYSETSCLDKYYFRVLPAIVKGINYVSNSFDIKFSIQNDGNIINATQDNYIDISVEFDSQSLILAKNTRVYCWIKDLKIIMVNNGNVTHVDGRAFCFDNGLVGSYVRRKDCVIDIINAVIRQYKLNNTIQTNSLT